MIRNVYSDLLYVGNAMDARDLKSIYDNQILRLTNSTT
jgi:hypothetical protein